MKTFPDMSGITPDIAPSGNRPAMVRYARARVRYVWMRMSMILVGCLSIALLAGPLTAALAVIIALLGELIDSGYLWWIANRMDPQGLTEKHKRLSGLTATLHACSIAFCVIVSVSTAPDPNVLFFALAFLVGASMDAGPSMSVNNLATSLRISVFAATTLFVLVVQETFVNSSAVGQFLKLVGIFILALAVYFNVLSTRASAARQSRSRAELLAHATALESAHAELSLLQEETRKLALVAQYANDIVLILDSDLNILWVNNAFTQVMGFAQEEVKGQHPADVLAGPGSDKGEMAAVARQLEAGEAVRSVVLNYTRDGRKIWLDTNLVPIMTNGRVEMIIGIERDITAARAQAKALEQARENAEASIRAKEAFLAMVSHEIRTPMNGILGMADVLASSDLTEAQKNYVATIHTSAEALLTIINDVLDVSKLNAGKLSIAQAPFSLAACVRDSADLLRNAAQEKGLYFDVVFETQVPPVLLGDQGRVRQILVNMIGNAVKFTEMGGVTVTVRHLVEGAEAQVTVRVEDTGIGVPQDRQGQIFEMFEQADSTTNRQFGGTGLGLAISRHLARKMSGDLVLVARRGPGACFEMTLGLTIETNQKSEDRPAPSDLPPTKDLNGLKVLVAEDNATNQLLLKTYLRDQNLDLRMVSNGREALEEVMSNPPDVILMDMSMPEMGGIEATHAIRATQTKQPVIIALTANAFETDKTACLEAGMNEFLSKPIRRADLVQTLLRVVTGEIVENSLGPREISGLSRPGTAEEVSKWISPPGSGTINGKLTPSSDP